MRRAQVAAAIHVRLGPVLHVVAAGRQLTRAAGADQARAVARHFARVVGRTGSAGAAAAVGVGLGAVADEVIAGRHGGADQVLVVNDENQIEIRTVSVLRADDKYAYVNGGISAGEQITTTAIEAPTNGMSVRTVVTIASTGDGGDEQIATRADEN